jgi:hypothetical protein
MLIKPGMASGHLVNMQRTHQAHYDLNGRQGPLEAPMEENFSLMVFRPSAGSTRIRKPARPFIRR